MVDEEEKEKEEKEYVQAIQWYRVVSRRGVVIHRWSMMRGRHSSYNTLTLYVCSYKFEQDDDDDDDSPQFNSVAMDSPPF